MPVFSMTAVIVPEAVISSLGIVPASMSPDLAAASDSLSAPSKKAYFTLSTSLPSVAVMATLPSAGADFSKATE